MNEPAHKSVLMTNEMDGRVINVYGTHFGGAIELGPDRIVINGRVVPPAEIDRGWVDIDDYAERDE